MPITNSFTCPNGHTFDAVAKIRARCPECGAMAKRPFGNQTTIKPVEEPKKDDVKPKSDKPAEVKGPVIIRQGRVRMAPRKVAAIKPTTKAKVTKSKVVLKKVGVVSMKRGSGTPTIKKLPRKTSVSKVATSISGRSRSYLDQVIDEYGF